MEIDFFKDEKQACSQMSSDEQAIEFSKKILDILRGKAKSHNLSNPRNKVSFSQLKKVFCEASLSFNQELAADKSINQWCMAKINSFLRLNSGHISAKSYKVNLSGTQLEISLCINPEAEDFQKADEDILNNSLNYSFGSVDELYLEEEKVIPSWRINL